MIARSRTRLIRSVKADKDHAVVVDAMKRTAATEPHDWAEKHDPTESIQVVLSHAVMAKTDDRGEHYARITRTMEQGRRRTVDARLWASLDDDQQEAMLSIQAGHRALIGGMGMKPANWERVSGGSGDQSHSQGIAAANYNAWVKEVDNTLRFEMTGDGKPNYQQPIRLGNGKAKNRWTLERLSPEAATAIICEGGSIDQVARDRRKETRWVKGNLIQALNVWLWQIKRLNRPDLPDEPVDGGLTYKQVRIRALNRRVENIANAIEEKSRVVRRAA